MISAATSWLRLEDNQDSLQGKETSAPYQASGKTYTYRYWNQIIQNMNG